MTAARKIRDWRPERVIDAEARPALSLAAEGLHTRMRNRSWLIGPLPDDPGAVAREIRAEPAEVTAAWEEVRKLWEASANGNGLVFPDLEVEREKALAHSERARKGAAVTNRSRWGDRSTDRSSDRSSDKQATNKRSLQRQTSDRLNVATRVEEENYPQKTSGSSSVPTLASLASVRASAVAAAPTSNGAAKKPRKKRTDPDADPEHAPFIAWFVAEYERVLGTPYVFQGGKDAAHVATLLRVLGAEEARRRASRLLTVRADQDAFLASTDRGLAVLAKCCNSPTLRGVVQQAATGSFFVPPGGLKYDPDEEI